MKKRIKQAVVKSGVRFAALQDLRHELHLISLRVRQRFSPWKRKQAAQLAQLSDVQLHFGCGSRVLPGWVNLDAYAGADTGISMEIDLQGKLPLSNGSVRWIFTEHVLEHLDRSRIAGVFSEFHRVLEAGGVARILVPDLAFYCQAYAAGDLEAITAPLPQSKTAAEAVNSLFNDHFHRFIYDFETMRLDLEKAGFRDIVHCEYGESRHSGLAQDSDQDTRRVGTLCVEATRSES